MTSSLRSWLAASALTVLLSGGAEAGGGSSLPSRADTDGVPVSDADPWARTASGSTAGADGFTLAGLASACGANLQSGTSAGSMALAFGGASAGTPVAAAAPHEVLGSERASILLRSLTLPGWGQATLGRRTSAVFFGLTETAVWGTFTAFRIQVAMRENAFLRTARLLAGIDLGGRDEEWRRIVGGFSSSDEYNRLVVARDAANLHYDDPVAYRAYIEAHSLAGADAWNWASQDDQARYRSQRRDAQRAAQRANTALAVAVVNRIVSALHAARVAGRPPPAAHAWRFEVVPLAGEDPTAFQCRVHARF